MSTGVFRSTPYTGEHPMVATSTTANLGAAGVFDSGVIAWGDYSQVQSQFISDQDGTLVINMYTDAAGLDAVRTLTIPYVGGSGYQFFAAPVFSDYIRYTYTNGATPQTDFYFETKFHRVPITPQLLGAEAFISPSMITQLNRSIVVGTDANGTYRNAFVSEDGSLVTSDFLREVARGNIPSISAGNKFGRTTVLPAAAASDVWNVNGIYTGHPTGAAETIDVVSTSGADVQGVTIYGLDAAGLEQQESLTLTGTTEVTSANTYSRCFRLTVDDTADNVGTITAFHTTTTANVFVSVAPGRNQSTVASFTVPSNKSMEIVDFNVQLSRTNGSAGSADITLRVREPGGVFRAIRSYEVSNTASIQPLLKIPIFLPPSTDISVRVEDVSDNNTSITAEYGYILTLSLIHI